MLIRKCIQIAMHIWAASWQNQQNGMCVQRRLRSAWASAQSDQSLCCALNGYLRAQCFFMRTANTLIRLGGCPDWSESSLGAHSLVCFVMSRLISCTLFFITCLFGGHVICDCFACGRNVLCSVWQQQKMIVNHSRFLHECFYEVTSNGQTFIEMVEEVLHKRKV